MEGYVFHGPADSFLARERRLARRRRARAVGAGARPGANARDLAHFAPVARRGRLLAFFGRNQPPFARAERRDFCVHGRQGQAKGQAKRAGAETNSNRAGAETISKQNRGAQARQAGQATQQASGSGCSDGPVGAKIQGAKMILGAPLHYLPAKTETGTRKKTRKGQESQALENPHMSKFKSRKTGTWSRVALHPVAAFACSA